MQPLALQVVLNCPTALNRCVNADTDDAEAEEEEHGNPLEHSHASALASHLGHALVIAVLASYLLRPFARSLLLYFLQGH